MEQRLFIFRALIFNKRGNNYSNVRVFKDAKYDNRNQLIKDFFDWIKSIEKRLDKDEVIINENIIE